MATNPLVSVQDLLGTNNQTFLATVISVVGTQVQVKTETGVIMTVYGTGVKIGNSVLVRNNSIIVTVSSEDTILVYIP